MSAPTARAVVWNSMSADKFPLEQLESLNLPMPFRPPAWSKLIWFMMQPAVQTLRAGFEAARFATKVGSGPLELLQSGLMQTLGPGDVFVWVGVGNLEWNFGGNNTRMVARDAMRNLTLRGVLTVFYSTESFRHHTCAAKRQLPVREIWEYTKSNVLCCPDDPGTVRVRHVPPGYVPRLRLAGSRRPAKAAGTGAVPKLVFFGSASSSYWMRHQCLIHVTRSLVAKWAETDAASASAAASLSTQCVDSVCQRCNASRYCPVVVKHGAKGAGEDREWDAIVSEHTLFLNVHKVCDWALPLGGREPIRASNASCESFRLAALLSAGADVFSEHCHPADEQDYEGLVRFLPMETLSSAVVKAWREGAGGASSAERRARLFAERFAPAAIFERAGLPAVLAAHRESRSSGWSGSSGSPRFEFGHSLEWMWSNKEPIRSVFPKVPPFCCLNEAECKIVHGLTDMRVRGDVNKLRSVNPRLFEYEKRMGIRFSDGL